jgi:hypothetical protein
MPHAILGLLAVTHRHEPYNVVRVVLSMRSIGR